MSEPKMETITLTRSCIVEGKPEKAGAVLTVKPSVAAILIGGQKAVAGEQKITPPPKTKAEKPAE